MPREYDEHGRPDGYLIRRRAVDADIPLITDRKLARAIVEALRARRRADLSTLPYETYLARTRSSQNG